MSERRQEAAINAQDGDAVICPECEEPIGTAERYCWNCGASVVHPASVPLHPFADYLDDLAAEGDRP